MDTGFSRRTNADRDIQPVAITSVDPVSRMATGITRIRNSIQINCSYAVGDAITVPAVGEQWYVERIDLEWRLYGRIPFNDATLNIEPEEGQVSVGSASGPLELNGTEVRSNGEVFRLNGVYYRDDGETLQRSTDKEVWEPIQAQSAGAIQLIGNALAGVPDPSALVDYLDDLSPEESDTLLALAEWASGLSDGIDGIWDVFCENPFFDALRERGTGDSPVEMVISGFQDLIDQLWSTLFCGFEGNLTPDTLLGGLQLLTGLFTGNDFVQGLVSLVGENAVGNDLIDAVTGITDFIQQLLDTFFCDFTGDLTPQAILDAITGVLSPLQNNPFVLGLASLSEETGNLLNLAVDGAIGLIDDVFRTLFCDFTGELTPQAIIDHIGTILSPLQSNLFIQGLQTIAETLGVGVGNLAADAVLGVTELVDQIFRLFFCDFTGELTPQALFDKISQVFGPLATNPFLLMLQRIAEAFGIEVNNLISDAIAGATRLLETLLNIVLCRWDQLDIPIINEIIELVDENFSPASILKWVYDLFAPFNDPNSIVGKVIVGLTDLLSRLIQAGLSAAQMTQMGLQDAISGLIEFARVIFDFVTCQMEESDILGLKNLVDGLPGLSGFVPSEILKTVVNMTYQVFDNPFFKMLKKIAETFGVAVNNFFNDVITGGLKLLELVFDIVFCRWDEIDLTKLATVIGLPGVMGITGFSPAVIVDAVKGFFDMFRPGNLVGDFILGLQGLLQSMFDLGLTTLEPVGLAARDAISGLFEFVRTIFRVITCDLSASGAGFQSLISGITDATGDFAPGGLIKLFYDLFQGLTDNALFDAITAIGSGLVGAGSGLMTSGLSAINNIVTGLDGIFRWLLKSLKTFIPFVPWESILPFGDSFWDKIDEIDAFDLSDVIGSVINLDGIPFIGEGVDFIEGLLGWSQENVVKPIALAFIQGLGIDLAKLGIESAAELANVGLTTISDIASNLLTSLGEVPAQLLSGVLPSSLLSLIPVSGISEVSPNLITLGSFAESVNVESGDGWSWDAVNAPGGTGGSAKVVVSSAKDRHLYARQAVPVAKGDRLVLSAKVKTQSLSFSGAAPISISLIPFSGSTQLATVQIGSSVGAVTDWTSIGQATDTYYEVTNASWTSVIVRLSVSSTATAGTVWWDEVSLTKTGLLGQGLVDSLIDAWNSMIGGLTGLGAPGSGYDWTSLFTAAANARSQGTTAQAQNANTVNLLNISPQSLISSLFSIRADGVNTIGEMLGALAQALSSNTILGSTVLDFYNAALQARTKTNTVEGALTTTNTNLFGTATAGTTIKETAVPSLTADKITSGTFSTARIADDAITNAKIGFGAVGSNEIAAYSIDNYRLAQDSVTNFAVASNAVNADSIASRAVGEDQIDTYAVTNYKIATDAVTNAKIATNAVNNDSIASNAVTSDSIANFAVGTNQLGTDAVTNAKIATNAVNNDSIASNAVNTDSIADLAVGTDQIGNLAVNNDKVSGIDGTRISTGEIPAVRIDTVGVGGIINPSSANGATISRKSVTNVSPPAGRNILPTGFFTHNDLTGAGITTNLSEGKFTVSTAGWYIVELSLYMNPVISFGYSVATLLYKGTSTSQSPYRIGHDARDSRYAKSTWIVHLNANEAVRAGYDGVGVASGIFDADLSGVSTYFSIALLSKTYT